MARLASYVIVVALATLGLAQAAQAQTFDDQLLRAYGQFEIDNGQTKTLAHGKHDRAYRICVRNRGDSVPLKVMHDGLESTVYPGDCTDVEGMHIQITPGARLEQGMALMGQYHHVN